MSEPNEFEEGYDAFISGIPLSNNPHTPGSTENYWWESGWFHASHDTDLGNTERTYDENDSRKRC